MNYMSKEERLQKLIAQTGFCSRRVAEEYILAQKVKVNGQLISELGTKFPNNVEITIDNQVITTEEKVYYLLYKPSKYLSATSDPHARAVVTDLLPSEYRLFPVGRLDYETTGILLLTNDGEFANLMMHPRYEIEKIYQVDIKGMLDVASIRALEHGIMLDERLTLPTKVTIKHKDFAKQLTRFEIRIKEGRNRQIRRMLESVGYPVTRLHRKQYGHLTLGGLKPGEYRRLKPYEVIQLRKLSEI